MRVHLTFGAVLILCALAGEARAETVEYWPLGRPVEAGVTGGGRTWSGFRLEPGKQITIRAKGPGVFRAFYFQQYEPGRPFPTDVRLLVAVDGAGKMFPLVPKPLPGMKFQSQPKGSRAIPSAPLPLGLKLGPGEHSVVYKLAANVSDGGVLAFPEAKRRGQELELSLDLEPAAPELELDLDLPVTAPTELALDLELGDLELPGEPAKPTEVAALDLELDLDEPAPAPAPTKPVAVAALTPRVESRVEEIQARPPADAGGAMVASRPTADAGGTRAEEVRGRPPADAGGAIAMVAMPVEPEKPRAPSKPFFDGPPPKLGPVEVGARAGWALTRGRLQGGQPMYLAEVGWRLEDAGLPKVRLVLTTGYTAIDATWRGIEPGLGIGSVQQTSQVVPFEVGATFEPNQGGRLSPFFGLALGAGVASTRVQRFSLAGRTSQAPAPGITGSAGLRFQMGQTSLVLEVRHNESFTSLRALGRPGVQVGQPTLSSTAALAGFLFSI